MDFSFLFSIAGLCVAVYTYWRVSKLERYLPWKQPNYKVVNYYKSLQKRQNRELLEKKYDSRYVYREILNIKSRLSNLFNHPIVVVLGSCGAGKTTMVNREIELHKANFKIEKWSVDEHHRLYLKDINEGTRSEELAYPDLLPDSVFVVDSMNKALPYWGISLEELITKTQDQRLVLVSQGLSDEEIELLAKNKAYFFEVDYNLSRLE